MLIVTPSSCRVVAFPTSDESDIRFVDCEVRNQDIPPSYARIEKELVKSVFQLLISPESRTLTSIIRGGKPVVIR
jgi:hypothetical protein